MSIMVFLMRGEDHLTKSIQSTVLKSFLNDDPLKNKAAKAIKEEVLARACSIGL